MTRHTAWTPSPLFETGEASVSYAQNAEDIRLARVLRGESGFYVDVGAGDPVDDSVTKLFYDRGWNGINIEPSPVVEKLEIERPRDVNLELAVAAEEGLRDFWLAAPDTGTSSLHRPDDVHIPDGITFEHVTVECRRLSRILEEHAPDRPIDFVKIDVEGGEEEVLRSLDLRSIRPTVLVVEAVAPLTFEPSHEAWEPLVLDAGYVLAAFDGVNRFYVPREHEELVEPLAYPVSALDSFVRAKELELRAAGDAQTLEGLDGRGPEPSRASPIVVLTGSASVEALVSTCRSLARDTEATFTLSVLDPDMRAAMRTDHALREALPPHLLAQLGSDGSPDAEAAGLRSLTASESDVVVVEAGAALPSGWLARLREVAHGDSICASACAVVVTASSSSVEHAISEPRTTPRSGFATVVERPVWGRVYIRRDAIDLTSWVLEAEEADPRDALADLREALAAPGLVHRQVSDVVVRYEHEAGAASGPAQRVVTPLRRRGRARVMIDGRCLDRPLSGTQVHVLSLLRGLGATGAVNLSVFLPRQVHESVQVHLDTVEGVSDSCTIDSVPEWVPEIFHRPYQFATVHELESCRGLGQRLVLTHQDMIMDRTPAYHGSEGTWMSFRETTGTAFAACDQVGFFSRHAAWDAASDGGLPLERINVVPLGVDHALGHERAGVPPAGFPAFHDSPFLLVVGGAYRHKNRLFAHRLFERLANVHEWDGLLVLAGDHPDVGSSIPDEEAFLARHDGIRERVVDVGRVTDGERDWLYGHAGLVLFPSLYEGFGLVPFEAAACGTPCVYGWRSSLPEYLPPEGGVLEGWQLPECADAVLRILGDEVRAKHLTAAITHAGSQLTWSRTAWGYVDVYERALAAPRRWGLGGGNGDKPRALAPSEARLLDVYRRRPVFRTAVDVSIGSGMETLKALRTLHLARKPETDARAHSPRHGARRPGLFGRRRGPGAHEPDETILRATALAAVDVSRHNEGNTPPEFGRVVFQAVSAAQFEHPDFQRLARYLTGTRDELPWSLESWPVGQVERKLWEWCYVLKVAEQHGKLAEGVRAVGFGVGSEPLPAAFASFGMSVLAADREPEESRQWARSGEHMQGLASLSRHHVVSDEELARSVELAYVDMNEIPDDLGAFDLVWSSRAMEHLGSPELGIEFVLQTLRHLEPGGVSVHTTELELTRRESTADYGHLAVYRLDDLVTLTNEARSAGFEIETNWYVALDSPADRFIALPPYPHSDPYHLKLALWESVSTSAGVVISRPA